LKKESFSVEISGISGFAASGFTNGAEVFFLMKYRSFFPEL